MKGLKIQMIFCFIIWGLIGFNAANLVHLFTEGADPVLIVLDAILVAAGIAIGILETAITFDSVEIFELQAKTEAVLELIKQVESEDDENEKNNLD